MTYTLTLNMYQGGDLFQKGVYHYSRKVTDTTCLQKVWLFFPFLIDPQDENKIGIDGIQQFCDDLSLDPASITVLVVAWKFRAATQCEFTKKEFLDGMTELG